MAGRLPTQAELHQQAEKGVLFTRQQVADIAQKESEHSGPGITAGGPAATAQSFFDKQQKFLAKADELGDKPTAAITKETAAEIQSLESKALGGIRPSKGSLSSTIQSIADQNEREANASMEETEAFITQDDAAAAQRKEAIKQDSQVSAGSVAAQVQSIADKTENLRNSLAEDLRSKANE